jgi:hypothetical protein
LAALVTFTTRHISVPFIINVHPAEGDSLFPNALDCSYYAEMHRFLEKLDLYTKNFEYLQNLNELHSVLKVDDKPNKLNFTFTIFRDDMSAREVS